MTDRTKSSNRIRILTVDDQPQVRARLKRAFERYPGAAVVGEVLDWKAAVGSARRLSPDLIVVGSGHAQAALETVQTLRGHLPYTKLMVVGDRSDAEFVLGFLHAGANGYALIKSSASELFRAAKAIQTGELFLSPALGQMLLGETEPGGGSISKARPAILSPRESEVLGLIAKGLTSRQIGDKLGISTRTVETHRERMKRKLDIHSVAGLTRYAIAHGFTDDT